MANSNKIQKTNEDILAKIENNILDENFDIDGLEEQLQNQFNESIKDIEILEEERTKINNPDALGEIVLNEIWQQFGNQIGLDMTNETLIQQYKKTEGTYDEVKGGVLSDKNYKDAQKNMKDKQAAGKLKDEYTGKKLGKGDTANLDHVVSRKEIYDNDRRRQAGLDTKDLANKKENLKPTNESLNKSKGEKSVKKYNENREQRIADLKKQNEAANKKIDASNLSEADKRAQKEKNNKRLQDKLDADQKRMEKADKEARKAINRDIRIGVAKNTTKKAAKDAVKQMAVTALFSLLKEIMNGFVRFLKSKKRVLENFLKEMKQAIKSFFKNISSILNTGKSSFIGTIVNEIFGPIVSTFKKLASLIKQGVASFMDAIKYLTNKENKDAPLSEKLAEVGKIITGAIVGGSAVLLGELFEKKLLVFLPVTKVEIPLLGSVANVVGMFLGSIVSGLVGAIIMNLLDKFIARKQKSELDDKIIMQKNAVLGIQYKQQIIAETKLNSTKDNYEENVKSRHKYMADEMQAALSNIMEDFVDVLEVNDEILAIDEKDIKTNKAILKIDDDLDDLLASLK